MKMSQFFFLPVCAGTVKGIDIRSTSGHYNDGVEPFEAAEYAINNHDRLTEQNAKLVESLETALTFIDMGGVYDEKTIHQYNSCIDLLNEIKAQ